MNNALKVSGTTIRTITLEEHFATPAFLKGPGAQVKEQAQARTFLDQLPVSPADKERIAHGNAELLLRF